MNGQTWENDEITNIQQRVSIDFLLTTKYLNCMPLQSESQRKEYFVCKIIDFKLTDKSDVWLSVDANLLACCRSKALHTFDDWIKTRFTMPLFKTLKRVCCVVCVWNDSIFNESSKDYPKLSNNIMRMKENENSLCMKCTWLKP